MSKFLDEKTGVSIRLIVAILAVVIWIVKLSDRVDLLEFQQRDLVEKVRYIEIHLGGRYSHE